MRSLKLTRYFELIVFFLIGALIGQLLNIFQAFVQFKTSDLLVIRGIDLPQPPPDGVIQEKYPKVFVVTPTFDHPEEFPDLTRVAQALLPSKDFIVWLVIEDSESGSIKHFKRLKSFISEFGLIHKVLRSLKRDPKEEVKWKAKGVGARRAGIQYLRDTPQDGVLYFADDDNTYRTDLFAQIQSTKKISMWPVGTLTRLGVSSPLVHRDNDSVVTLMDGWIGAREFPVDFAEFAINLEILQRVSPQEVQIPWIAGYIETKFLTSLKVKLEDIEIRGNHATEVLAWHTKTALGQRTPKNKSLIYNKGSWRKQAFALFSDK